MPSEQDWSTIASLATAIAVLLAFFQLRIDAKRDTHQKVFDTYNALNDQYVSLLRRSAEAPWVDCFDRPLQDARDPIGPAEERMEESMFLEAISLLERAYVFYCHFLPEAERARRAQWEGWVMYSASFATRRRFIRVWSSFKNEFDERFVAWMDTLIPADGKAAMPHLSGSA